MQRLQNKVALVTGAGSSHGIGVATAERFAEEGAIVYLTDVDVGGVTARADKICASGGRATGLAHDIAARGDWARILRQIFDENGRIDVLVNNAGIAVYQEIDDVTCAAWARQIDVNLTGTFHGTQLAVREMRRVGEGGSIINISSIGGQIGMPGYSAYCATKGAIRLFTKAVALETARDQIRVNSVHPGTTLTNMMLQEKEKNEAQHERTKAAVPLGYMAEPLEVANAVLYLASQESRYITGSEITVDGGFTAQ